MVRKTYNGMGFRRSGRSGLWLSEIGLGLWKWGDPTYDGSRVGEHEGFRILDRSLELGITHWDTANSYNSGSGNCERLLGKYFSSRDSFTRDSVVLATKIRNSVRGEHESGRTFPPTGIGSSRKYILSAVDDCLKRLKTDRIDILYHHFPDIDSEGQWETPLEESWSTLHDLVRSGKVLYLAVSNRSRKQLVEENNALLQISGANKEQIIAVQNRYNLVDREKVAPDGEGEASFFDTLREKKIGLIPLVPLAVGFLTGRYRKGKMDPEGRLSTAADKGFADDYFTDRNFQLLDKMDAIAENHGVSLAQVATAWLLSHEEIPSVITGITRMEHLEDNAAAVKLALSSEELNILNRESEALL